MSKTPDVVRVHVDLADASDYPVEPAVGTKWQVGINGVGYMLADHPEKGIEYRRGLVSLDPPRLATTETPFSQAIERYTFAAQHDWSGGAGQRMAGRDSSDPTRFWDSEGVDPFDPAVGVRLLPSTSEILDSAATGMLMCVADSKLYIRTSTDDLTILEDGQANDSVEVRYASGTAVADITGLTSDGKHWYAATGSQIVRSDANESEWTSDDVVDVRWLAGRIVATVKTGSNPNKLNSYNSSGTEERPGGLLTLGTDESFVLGGFTSGHVYVGASGGSGGGRVYAWPIGLDSSGNVQVPFVAADLPAGARPVEVFTAGGSVWVRTVDGAGVYAIYRGIPDDGGFLTLAALLELAPRSGSADGHGMVEWDGKVLFAYPQVGTGSSGLGCVDLASGGYARWLASGVSGRVDDVDVWLGRPVFSVSGQGVFQQTASGLVSSGWVESSVFDGASALDKVFDDLTLVTAPVGASQSVAVSMSWDGGGSFSSLATQDDPGITRTVMSLAKRAEQAAVKVTLSGPGTTTPSLRLMSLRMHPLGLADSVVVIPVDCSDEVRFIGGEPIEEYSPGSGMDRARLLESYVQRRVKFQDVDWHHTGVADVWEVIDVQTSAVIMYDHNYGTQTLRQICQLTLRRPGRQGE